MNRKFSIFILVFCCLKSAYGQVVVNENKTLIHTADSLFEIGDFQQSSRMYRNAFSKGKAANPIDLYKAGVAFARTPEIDTAFHYFNHLIKYKKYSIVESLPSDSNLVYLHSDERWPILLEQLIDLKNFVEKDMNLELKAALELVFEEDQKYRSLFRAIEDQFGRDSDEFKNILSNQRHMDSLNQIVVLNVLDKYGWLGKEIVGEKGNSVLFMVIQHADLPIQKKYLPMMKLAVQNGDAAIIDLVKLEDRIAAREGRKQTYGSQIFTNPETGEQYVYPVRNPELLDERRRSIGLLAMEEYLSYYTLEWDVEKHKALTKRMEAKGTVIP